MGLEIGPLVLAATGGRSGSSMVCGLFAAHGFWTGPTKSGDHRNPDGFFENMEMYRASGHYGMFKRVGGIAKNDGKWPEIFKNLIKKQGYKSGPIIMKHLPNLYPIWDDLDAMYVTVRRNLDAQIASREKIKKPLPRERLEERESLLDWLEERGAYRIDSERIIAGDFSQLAKPFDMCGIQLDKKICRNFVNPDYWHFSG